MLTIRSSADLARALDDPLDPVVRRLLTLRCDQLLEGGVADIGDAVTFIVARRGDTLAAVEAEVGLPIAGDESAVEWTRRHPGGWLEAAVITSDDHATAIFAANCICTDPDLLLAMLAHV